MTTPNTPPLPGQTQSAGDIFLHTTPLDPLSAPLLKDLEREYEERYSDMFDTPVSTEMNRYPVEDYIAPRGTFLLLLRDGAPVSGGAFRTHDEHTVEIKRVWTHPEHRGQGLAKRVLVELEAEAARRGFTEVTLSTGPRQPEAVRLYLGAQYVPHFDQTHNPMEIGEHLFTKTLPAL